MKPLVLATPEGQAVMVRDARHDDQAFVTSSWALNLCSAGEVCAGRHHRAGRAVSCEDSRRLVDAVSDHATTRVVVACDPARSDDLFGWLAYVPMPTIRLVHFAYVRASLRGRGIVRAMMEATDLDDARPLAWTLKGSALASLQQKFPSAIYQPIKEFLAP